MSVARVAVPLRAAGPVQGGFSPQLDAFEVAASLPACWPSGASCNRGQSRERVSTFVLCLVERVPKFAQCDLRNGKSATDRRLRAASGAV